MSEEQIWIVTREMQQPGENSRSWLEETAKTVRIPVDELAKRMSYFLTATARIFRQADEQVQQVSGLQLAEINLTIEISAEGEVKLLGSGGKIGGNGAISLTFKRS